MAARELKHYVMFLEKQYCMGSYNLEHFALYSVFRCLFSDLLYPAVNILGGDGKVCLCTCFAYTGLVLLAVSFGPQLLVMQEINGVFSWAL